MNNVLDNVKFGDKFITRGGNVSICINAITLTFCSFDNDFEQEYIYHVNKDNGIGRYVEMNESPLDIVSKCVISETELDKLAEEEITENNYGKEPYSRSKMIVAFKMGAHISNNDF